MTMKLVETPDLNKLEEVLKSPFIYSSDVKRWYDYAGLLKEAGGSIQVEYRQKAYNGTPYGRYYPFTARSPSGTCLKTLKTPTTLTSNPSKRWETSPMYCVNQWSSVRPMLFGEKELDIDIVNCHPTILLDLCNTHNIKSPLLAGYVHDRDSFISDLQLTQTDVDTYNSINTSASTLKDLGKFVFTMTLYGSSLKTIKDKLSLTKSPFKRSGKAKELHDEIKRVTLELVGLPEYETLKTDIETQRKKDRKPKAHPGTFLSMILQTRETEFVVSAIDKFQKAGIEVTSYIYDGFQVRVNESTGDKEKEILAVLDDINSSGIPVKFIIKPFKAPLDSLTFARPCRTPEAIEKDEEDYRTNRDSTAIRDTLDYDPDEPVLVDNDYQAAKVVVSRLGHRIKKLDDEASNVFFLIDNVWSRARKAFLSEIQGLNIVKPAKNDVGYTSFAMILKSSKDIMESALNMMPIDPDFLKKQNALLKDYLYYNNGVFCFKTKRFFPWSDPEADDIPRPFFKINTDFTGLMSISDPKVQLLKNKILCCFENEEQIEYVMRCMARAASGHVEDKVFYIISGARSSGKGTFQELFKISLGGYVGECNVPIARSTSSGDPAMDNRQVLTLNQHLTRISFSNETTTLQGKQPVLDGSMLKKVVASAGDTITARVMRGNEVSVVVNSTFFYSLNELPRCEPADALQTARLFHTSFQFIKQPDGCTLDVVKTADDGIKTWIRTCEWIPMATLSLLSHYWSTENPKNLTIPEDFKIESEELMGKVLDAPTLFAENFIKDFEKLPDGNFKHYIEADKVVEVFAEVLGWSVGRCTSWLKKNGIVKDPQKRFGRRPDGTEDRRPVYKGIKFKESQVSEEVTEAPKAPATPVPMTPMTPKIKIAIKPATPAPPMTPMTPKIKVLVTPRKVTEPIELPRTLKGNQRVKKAPNFNLGSLGKGECLC